jgi:hypothetical protein
MSTLRFTPAKAGMAALLAASNVAMDAMRTSGAQSRLGESFILEFSQKSESHWQELRQIHLANLLRLMHAGQG